jgi:hypothetical protein
MKKTLGLTVLLTLLGTAAAAFARTYSYPVDRPTFSIDFPDAWNVELNTKEVAIVAQSPDKEIEYDIWKLPNREVKEDVKGALNDAVKDVNEIIEQYVTDVSFGEWHPKTIRGMEFLWAEGQGKYKDGGQTVYMEVNFFSPDDRTIYVLVYWGTKEGENRHKAAIEQIDKSIRKAQ